MSTLEVNQLTIINGGKEKLFQNLSVTFLPGQFWCLFGLNGSGKTSFLHTLAGLKKPTKGDILLDQIPILNWPAQKRAQKLGLLLQETEFPFPQLVSDLVMTGRFPHSDKDTNNTIVDEILTHLNLKSFQHRSVQTLSGGEKQRVLLAALLAQTPNIYLLDEPLNHLDLKQRIVALSFLKKLTQKENKTVVAVLHDPHLIQQFCSHLLWIENGHTQMGECSAFHDRLAYYINHATQA